MTPDELAEEIAEAPGRALNMMMQAKETTHRGQKPVPPILHAMREDGSTLQISGPPGYELAQELQAAVAMLRLAEAWSPNHTVVAFDTRRIFDPSVAPVEAERAPGGLFESTATSDDAVSAMLAHSFDTRHGNSAEALCYSIDADGSVQFSPEVTIVDDAWLAWAEIPHTMSQCLTPRRDFIGGRSFEDEVGAADIDRYGIFVIEYAGDSILVRVWGNNYREEAISGELPRDEITSRIERVFAASRLMAVSSEGDAG